MLLLRLAAFAVDYAVLAVYLAVLSLGFLVLPSSIAEPLFSSPTRGQATAFVILTLPVVMYFAVMESSRGGATLGKRLLSVRVVGPDGTRCGRARSLVRSGVKFTPWELAHTSIWRLEGWPTDPASPSGWTLVGLVAVWALIGVSVLMAVSTRRCVTLHDAVSGTRVVRSAG
ncbi:MAG: RDD family protein [Phycisphaerales bacterium]